MSQVTRTEGLVGNTAIKAPVKAASTAALVLSGEQTIDGVACVTGDRVLVKNQASGVNNGIYVVDTGDWERAQDFDGSLDAAQGTLVKIGPGGTANADTVYQLDTADPIVIGTTSLSFSVGLFSGLGNTNFLQGGAGAVVRSAQGKMREWVSVTDFGATGDGVTNDTVAMQAAHDALGANGVLMIPAGTFLAANFRITKSHITIECQGTIKPLAIGSTVVIIGKNAAGQTVGVRGLRGNICVDSGSTFAVYTGATGIDIQYLYESDLFLEAVGCNVGVDFSPDYSAGGGATSAGISYNVLRYGNMTNNAIARRFDPKDATSWVNENTHIGGRFAIDSGTYTGAQISDYLTAGAGNEPNNNLFLKPSYEGAAQAINSRGIYNRWIDPRLEVETTGTAGVDYAATYISLGAGSRERFEFGYSINLLLQGVNNLGAGTATGTRSFTMVGDFTTQLFRGQIAALAIGGTDYGVVIAESSYSAPNTTVRVSRPAVSGNPTAVKVPRITCADTSSQNNSFFFQRADLSSGGYSYETWHRKALALLGVGGLVSQTSGAFPGVSLIPSSSAADRGFRIHDFTKETGWIDHNGNGSFLRIATQAAPATAINTSPATNNVAQTLLTELGVVHASADATQPMNVNRKTDDGTLINFLRDGVSQGTISVAGGVVTLNAFLGSHWTQLVGNEYIADLPLGTVLEGTEEMCRWPESKDDDNRLCRTRICDTPGSAAVQGTFHHWDIAVEPSPPKPPSAEVLDAHAIVKAAIAGLKGGEVSVESAEVIVMQNREALVVGEKHEHDLAKYDDARVAFERERGCNDIVMASTGRGWVRMAAGQKIELGDLVEAAGNGCARVQGDALIHSSTIGKIHGIKPVATHADGSFTVACGLLCG